MLDHNKPLDSITRPSLGTAVVGLAVLRVPRSAPCRPLSHVDLIPRVRRRSVREHRRWKRRCVHAAFSFTPLNLFCSFLCPKLLHRAGWRCLFIIKLAFLIPGELVNFVFQVFDYLLRAPILETLKIEEVRCGENFRR